MRPFHEEMTAGLLEEVEKRRAQKTSRGSTSRDPSGFATAVLAATAANSANSTTYPASPSTSEVGAVSTLGTTSERSTFGGKAMAAVRAATSAGRATTPAASTAIGAHPPGATASIDKSRQADSTGSAVFVTADQSPSVEGRVEAAQAEGEVLAATKQRVEAERRQAALATIEKHRSHRHTASATSPAATAASGAVTTGGSTTLPLGAGAQEVSAATKSVATMSVTRAVSSTCSLAGVAAAGKPCLSMSTAFSRQSVRSGETLGYYGREEVDVLSAISKNPSRIAAYNRITEGKTGKNEDGPSSEVMIRTGVR